MSRAHRPAGLQEVAALAFLRCSLRAVREALAQGDPRGAAEAAGLAMVLARRGLSGAGASSPAPLSGRTRAARRAVSRIAEDAGTLPGRPQRRGTAGLETMARSLERRLPPLADIARRGAQAAAALAERARGEEWRVSARREAAARGSNQAFREDLGDGPLQDAARTAPLLDAATAGILAVAAMEPPPPEARAAARALFPRSDRPWRPPEAFPSAKKRRGRSPRQRVEDAYDALRLEEVSRGKALRSRMGPEPALDPMRSLAPRLALAAARGS